MCSFLGQEFCLGKYKFNSLFFIILIKTLPRVEPLGNAKKKKEENHFFFKRLKEKSESIGLCYETTDITGEKTWGQQSAFWILSLSHMPALLWVSFSPSAWL